MSRVIDEDIKSLTANLSEFEDKIKDHTFLVAGGAGFIGSWFCETALAMGANVICIDNLSSGSMKNIERFAKNPKFTFVQQDLLEYEPAQKADYIVNMASIATPPLYMRFPVETLDTNIIGMRKLLEIAVKGQVKGFLVTSTSEVYGNPTEDQFPTKETFHGIVNSFGPRCMYDEGKRAAEAYCYSYYHKFKVPVRIARIFNTFGPRLDVESTSQYGRALIKFVHQSLKGNPITVYGDGKQTRSFCYITDNIEGLFRLLLTPGIDGEVFNIGNPKEHTIVELAKLIVELTGSESQISVDSPANYNLKDDPRRRCPDITKANKMFGYSPKVVLEDGLTRVISWMKGE